MVLNRKDVMYMFDIGEELKKLPQKPGVYLMKNNADEIIYVGKAINLKNRVRQYFQSSKNQTLKVKNMVPHIKEFEYIITDSEMEALILECNLIKKHNPKYNILLKDDKMYPYIKITLNEAFPRIFMTRHFGKDKAKYLGPITDAGAVKETLDLVHKLWPIRKCQKVLPRDIGKERPCLNFDIGQCSAPCDKRISQEEYGKMIKEAIAFLEGKQDEIVKKMEQEMKDAAELLDFEKAAALRDKIKSIQSISEKQKMSNQTLGDCDIIAMARAYEEALVQVFFVRGGKMSGRENFMLYSPEDTMRSEILTEFVKQYYSGAAFIPKEIILEEELVAEETAMLLELLSTLKGSKVTFTIPKTGEKKKLVLLSAKNASLTLGQFGDKLKREQQRTIGAMAEISQLLGFHHDIKRIESYDISNIQGFEPVGSMVVFEGGKAQKSEYRKFKIKTVSGANDYASMIEVLTRRFQHALLERKELEKKGLQFSEGRFTKLPDLIMMDGGKIQVHAAETVLSNLGLQIPVCGMVKDDHHRTRGLIYQENEIEMDTHSEGFRLATRIQDEVHRFAIEYHRKLREKESIHSQLDDIEGIGSKRRKALLRAFGDIMAIKRATEEELCQVDGMDRRAARAVYLFFH